MNFSRTAGYVVSRVVSYRVAPECCSLSPRQSASRHGSREPFSNGLTRRGIKGRRTLLRYRLERQAPTFHAAFLGTRAKGLARVPSRTEHAHADCGRACSQGRPECDT